MNAVDTNVLIYARDPRNPAKQAIAKVGECPEFCVNGHRYKLGILSSY